MEVVKGPDNAQAVISRYITMYEKDLLRLCCVILRDVTLAEDAVQDTFLKAFRNIHTFRGESSPKTWLVSIAVNVCRDMRRTAWFRIARNAIMLDDVQIADEGAAYEVRSDLVTAVMHLPHVCREVVLLHHYEGLTQTEIANALHVSNTTVHRRLKKAYKLLKTDLKGGETYEA